MFRPRLCTSVRVFVARRSVVRGFSSKEPAEQPTASVSKLTAEHHVAAVDPVSGTPEDLKYRMVRIFKPARTAMQSGTAQARKWQIDFDVLSDGGRWENPLIGWASSADAVQSLRLKFATREDAIYYAEKQGWSYFIQEPHEKHFKPKSYSDNYKYSPGKLRIIKTK